MNFWQKLVLFQILPWTFIAGGGVATCLGTLQLVDGLRSRSWPQVKGKVIASEVTRSSGSISSGSSSTRFRASITYEYVVGGTTYIGDRVGVSDSGSTSSAKHHRIAARYPPGAEITVYHHPDKVDQALLEPGIRGATVVLTLAGLLALGIGLGIKWLYRRLVF